MAGCSSQPIVRVTAIDGATHNALGGVKVEYYGDADSILSRSLDQNRRIILGFTKVDGTITINTYPDRQLTELYFLKPGYAPGLIKLSSDDQSIASVVSPWINDRSKVLGEGQGATVAVTKPITINLYPYKADTVPEPLSLPGISPNGADDGGE